MGRTVYSGGAERYRNETRCDSPGRNAMHSDHDAGATAQYSSRVTSVTDPHADLSPAAKTNGAEFLALVTGVADPARPAGAKKTRPERYQR